MNWIGVKLGPRWEQRKRRVSIPGKKLTELREEVKSLIGKGTLSFNVLRLTHRRARGAVNIPYAALTNYGKKGGPELQGEEGGA